MKIKAAIPGNKLYHILSCFELKESSDLRNFIIKIPERNTIRTELQSENSKLKYFVRGRKSRIILKIKRIMM
jgi:hypothetical protein